MFAPFKVKLYKTIGIYEEKDKEEEGEEMKKRETKRRERDRRTGPWRRRKRKLMGVNIRGSTTSKYE